MRTITRKHWDSLKPHGYAYHMATGQPAIVTMDPGTGATILELVRVQGLDRREYACAVCGEVLTESECARLAEDVDFVPHGDRGHLIRVEGVTGW